MTQDLENKTILIVDDEADIRHILSEEFQSLGAITLQAGNVAEAVEIFDKSKVDLVVTDIRMPGGSGLELLKHIRRTTTEIPVLLMTGFADISLPEAHDLGAETLVQKPFDLDLLDEISVQLVKPLEERWKGKAIGLPIVVDGQDLIPGRGGFFVQKLSTRPSVGDNIILVLGNGAQYGVVCRWWQNAEGWGAEIDGWDDKAQSEGWAHNSKIPFIPLRKHP